ncbi:MAG: hypothetical protein HRU01_08375, partial [Myxococcales bacterium]|nr:hypothetical protein [Myxococcales bacterium]
MRARRSFLLRSSLRITVAATALTAGLVAAQGATAVCSGFVVTSASDSGDGTLRDCIQEANASGTADTITFADSLTITLDSALPIISNDTNIDGGSHTITIDGNDGDDAHRVFFVRSGSTVLRNLRVVNGRGQGGDGAGNAGGGLGAGGGLFVDANTTVVLIGMSFDGSEAIGGDGGDGSGSGGGGGGGIGGNGGANNGGGGGF